MGLGIVAPGQVVPLVAGQLAAIGQDTRVLLALGTGHVRVPGHPGIDLVVLEGGSAVGGNQVGRGDVLEGQPGLGQGLDQQVVAACGLGHRNALALRPARVLSGESAGTRIAWAVGEGVSRAK